MMANNTNTKEVMANINGRLDKLYHKNDEEIIPFVCLICDEFVSSNDLQRLPEELLQANSYLLIPDDWNSLT
jgi:hypothetical protein